MPQQGSARGTGRTGPRSTRDEERFYTLLSEVYDRVYSWKDYGKEAARIRQLVRRWGSSSATTLLDVACGTGEHLRHLARSYVVTGLDTSGPMLRVARAKVPNARFVRADMRTFRLREQFDVVTCLFSSIGYVRSTADLDRTVANLARHAKPGGLVIVEPWLSPSVYRPGHLGQLQVATKELRIVRMNSAARRRGRSVLEMHYLVGRRQGIRHWVERHDMGLFDDRTMRRAFRRAGLSVRRVESGFTTRRGLYLARSPLDRGPPDRKGATRRATRRTGLGPGVPRPPRTPRATPGS